MYDTDNNIENMYIQNIYGESAYGSSAFGANAVQIPTLDICAWIISRGGWNNLRIFDIMTLVSTYLGQTNLGFTIAIAHIMGTVAYYLNNLPSGNSLTGCSFT